MISHPPTERVPAKRVERDLEGGAELWVGQGRGGGECVVRHEGEHEGAASHVPCNTSSSQPLTLKQV